jgi:hypothetical protein
MEVINPQLKELEQKFEVLQITVSQMRGELDEVKRTSGDTTRQTIWQFVIFTVTMAAILLGGIKYQTDTLRNEMNVRFDAMNQRIEQSEKNITARFEDLKQEVRANRK